MIARPSSLPDPDVALIRRMANGDEDALTALYGLYGHRLFAYALHLTGQEPLAEEIVQDSLLAAWKAARTYRAEGRLITWLLGIVHHQALNATRRKYLPAVELDEAVAVAGGEDPEDAAEFADRRRIIAAALASLSTEHRSVIELVFYQKLSLAEAAQVCGCPLGTIKSRLSYAKDHLLRSLNRAGIHMEDLL